jgi:ERCC4-related helicase
MQRYPKNPEVREYQQEIVTACVCSNTLVCLPTGLGKTHIAAVLIANFITWFPSKKVIFLAPTRPLVRQQVSALDNLREMVPRDLILEVSGQLAAKKR